MEIHVDEVDGVFIFELSGALDFGYSRDFELLVETLIDKGVRRLVFVLHGLTDIVSSGLGSFMRLAAYTRRGGGRLALVGVSDKIRTSLEWLTVQDYFEFYATEEEALRAMAGPAVEGA
ncbi:MAG: STAS domain-containing protein [Planctomycetes bacterium]|nr:STAS domain-containing protein [Planctomycetota bacterium]